MTVRAHIAGDDPVAHLRRFRWTTMAAGWADTAIPVILAAIDEETPVRTGELQKRNRVTRQTVPGHVQIRFSNTVAYAEYVIGGTKPHGIFPLHAKALHFDSDQGEVFAKHVMHPGTKPNPFHTRGYQKVSAAVEALMDRKLKETLA